MSTLTTPTLPDAPASAVLLTEVVVDASLPWRIHNCKLTLRTCQRDLPQPFLYHYDQLDAAIKAENPLTPRLLTQFNAPMHAAQAAQHLGLPPEQIPSAWHVKINGSLVVFCEPLALALRLQWSNTSKDTQAVYCDKQADAISLAIQDWQFFGRVDVLKRTASPPVLLPADSPEHAAPLLIAQPQYQQLPRAAALMVLAQLEEHKAELPWFEQAIQTRLD